MRMSKKDLAINNNMYQILGLDFILDEDIKLWFIEANIKPAFLGTSDEKRAFLIKMLSDHYDIVYGLLRSRIKRTINFVNKITKQVPDKAIFAGIDYLPNYAQIKKAYDLINKNYMEPEFEIGSENGFEKVIDENLKGIDIYQGLLAKECI